MRGEVRKREGCPGENHPGCVHTVPSPPSSAGQRSMGSLVPPAVSPLSWEGKTHGLMGKHDPLNESDPDFWGQKAHHRLINKPLFVLFPELQVHWTLESSMWDGTWVPQTALFKVLLQQSRALSTAKIHWAEGLLWHPAFSTYSIPTS